MKDSPTRSLDPSDQEVPQGSSSSGVPAKVRALRHRNFQLFFAGQLISLIGTWMQTVAQSWLVYRLTGSAVLLGTVAFASQIPVFLFATVGGIVADRLRKHPIVVFAQIASMLLAFILAWLTLTDRIQVWHIITLASLLGTVNAFDIPARQSFLVEMVGKDDLINAIGLNSSMFNGARVIGPAVAGIMVASIGEGWCFLVNAVSYIAVIVGLMMMRLAPPVPRAHGAAQNPGVFEGFRYAWRTGPVLALLLLIALVSMTGMPYSVLMPIFADKILHGGARGLGMLMCAIGVGATMGALTLAMRSGLRGLSRLVAMSSAGFGLGLIFFSMSRSFWLSMAVLVPTGYSVMLQMATANTMLQTMAPDHLRGRVMGLYSMMFMGMAPIGALGAGFTAARLGAPLTVAIGGVVCLVGSALFARRLPQIRAETRELLVAQGMIGGEPVETVVARTNS